MQEKQCLTYNHSITDSYLLLALFLVPAYIITTTKGKKSNEIMDQKEHLPGQLGCFHSVPIRNSLQKTTATPFFAHLREDLCNMSPRKQS